MAVLLQSFPGRAQFHPADPALDAIADKVFAGERLDFADGIALYGSPDILAVGWLANRVREKLHGNVAYFNVNRHINPTNVCVAACRLCAFGRKKTVPEPTPWLSKRPGKPPPPATAKR